LFKICYALKRIIYVVYYYLIIIIPCFDTFWVVKKMNIVLFSFLPVYYYGNIKKYELKKIKNWMVDIWEKIKKNTSDI